MRNLGRESVGDSGLTERSVVPSALLQSPPKPPSPAPSFRSWQLLAALTATPPAARRQLCFPHAHLAARSVAADKYDLDWMVTGVREATQRIFKSGSYAWLPLLPLLQHHKVQVGRANRK